MAHTIVKLLTDPYGVPIKDPVWHLSITPTDCDQLLCTGEVFGPGNSAAEYDSKDVQKGGITCAECLKIIKAFKAIKL